MVSRTPSAPPSPFARSQRRSVESLGDQLRPLAEPVTYEIARAINRRVPGFARPADRHAGRWLVTVVGAPVRGFADIVDEPTADLTQLTDTYIRPGAREAGRGHGLDNLEAALRLSSQIACRRLIQQARRLDWPHETLATLIEWLFQLLDRLVEAAAEGHTAANHHLVTGRERRRAQLRDALVADPPSSKEAIAELAGVTEWPMPDTICVIVPHAPARNAPILPPTVLADWSSDAPFLIVPDPGLLGQERLIAGLTDNHPGAVGPTVPRERGAISLSWARHAAALMTEAVLPAEVCTPAPGTALTTP